MQQLILIRGLPGSGKSTLARKLKFSLLGAHLETDQYFVDKQGKYVFDASKLKQNHEKCLRDTELNLKTVESVIVSNTFTQLWELEPYFELAHRFGITPTVIMMQSQFQNEHGVPEEKLQQMKNRFAYDITDLFEKYRQ